ncbi:hypothetical protein J3E72DRAFT_382125 [Bipolaris maydis]|nr:hypothetical protein J3E73DRAFT_223258 [Bipolaris maydis]KAJ6201527.1 hypothetical protein J3E72DRAFT_382125 [Bipolaris maydis]KAJ6285052.1 hypothetical protein J3E71DRAFT_212411 [Bipolaris maydis]
MPFILFLAAPRSPHRLGRCVTRLAARLLPSFTAPPQAPSFSNPNCRHVRHHSSLPACHRFLPSQTRCLSLPHRNGPPLCRLEALQTLSRRHTSTSNLAPHVEPDDFPSSLDAVEDFDDSTPFRAQLSRNARKALRKSRPVTVLESINSPAKDLYRYNASSQRSSSCTVQDSATQEQDSQAFATAGIPVQHLEPVSLYSVLARYLKYCTSSPPTESNFRFTALELHLLRSKGYRPESVEQWAACLVEPKCNVAAAVFEQQYEAPPLFLLLLFLRRRHIRVHSLGIIMRHLDRFVQSDTLEWSQLKIVAVRLLRHVREVWPESMTWITSFLTAQSSRLHDRSPRMLSDMTRFFNSYLVLLCLPTSVRPLVCATYQEKAQFQILKYMASTSPSMVVSRPGFRAVARNQLAHAKTTQERDWAELKGPSWPPWKENRTAMDEEKGYNFGASRASQLLHRMYEAGYTNRMFEDMVQIYAGWDTDNSPTIQTRTTLPHVSSRFNDNHYIRPLLWAARIRTTRTRREAWACFLSHELSGESTHSEVYLAMFEKLHYSAIKRIPAPPLSADADQAPEDDGNHLLPGDMKEVLPDPSSSLHYVYLSEPVPEYKELLERMRTTNIKPSHRLLAFLLETCPDFHTCLNLLHMSREDFNGGIGRILYGMNDDDASVRSVEGYLFTAIIRFLCRFGRFERPLPREPTVLDPQEHVQQIRTNKNYLLEYAHGLLVRYRPKYRPAWAIFINKLLHQRKLPQAVQVERYRVVCDLLEHIEQADVDVDDDIFGCACMATTYAAQSMGQSTVSIKDARLLSTGSARLRSLFNSLVGANVNMHSHQEQPMGGVISPHVPGPTELHLYVRALGALGDYEGLYSFTTWLTNYRSEVSVRAQAQRGGMDTLFRMLVALRLAISGGGPDMGSQHESHAPEDIALLIRKQIEGVEEWGGWPTQEHVKMYIQKQLKSQTPSAGGR